MTAISFNGRVAPLPAITLLCCVAFAAAARAQVPGTHAGASAPPDAPTAHAAGADVGSRELDDKVLPNFHRVGERLFRGAQPHADGIKTLAALGINTVINLRDDDDRARAEEREARLAGLRYFNVPFKSLGRPSDEDVRRVLELIDAPENGKVFLHCRRGADRTGTVIAIYRITHDGWTSERALDEADEYGMRFWQRGMKDYIRDYARTRDARR